MAPITTPIAAKAALSGHITNPIAINAVVSHVIPSVTRIIPELN